MNYKNFISRYYLLNSKQSEAGYAMLIVSLITIVLLGLLAAFLKSSQTSLDTTNALTDGNNTFYAAESALNLRAEKLRQIFTGFNRPSGLTPGQTLPTDPVTQANVAACFTAPLNVDATTDFGCENSSSNYNEARIANVFASAGNSYGGSNTITTNQKPTQYNTYTFVTDTSKYNSTIQDVDPIAIPSDEVFGGLNALEYKYTVFASAVNVNLANEASPLDTGFAQSILQMDLKSRVVPLFQFQIFSDRDLEITSGVNPLSGRVHANGNLYIQSYNSSGVSLNKKITSAGDIYNRIDSGCIELSGVCSPTGAISVEYATGLYDTFPAYQATPLSLAQLSGFHDNVKDRNTVKALVTPDLSFLRKRNYQTGVVGDYFGKADLRIEMVPDRVVPFDVTAIQTGATTLTGTCNTTPPVMGSDPSIDYIDPKRQGASPKCAKLNVGQLMSLQQPVLVMAKGNSEEEARFCQSSGSIDRVRDLINYGSYAASPTMLGLSIVQQDKVLHALRVAIASSTTSLDYTNVINVGVLPIGIKLRFQVLLFDSTLAIGLTPSELAGILSATPASLAKARNGCFLPASISMVKKSSGASGVFDQQRNQLMTILQTNIESLTVWNRDGWYVNMGTNPLISPVVVLTDTIVALNTPTNSTNSLLFVRAPVNGSVVGSFNNLGLGAIDRTEKGLVIHATVNDNLSGDGSMGGSTNVTSSSDPIIKTSPKDRTPILDSTGNPTVVDYYRRYKGGAIQQSPYGFAFSRGANLPAPLTIATDQAAYLLGNWNTIDYQPASLLADDITALSNNCVSPGTAIDPGRVRTGQMNCAIPTSTVGIVPWSGNAVGDHTFVVPSSTVGSLGKMYVAVDTTYNLATLTGKADSIGNSGTNRGSAGGGSNGGLGNYFNLLELWANKKFQYKGSMLQIGSSLESNTSYRKGGTSTSYYYPPDSSFSYDSNFDTFTKLPPLTPQSVYLIQSVFSQ